MANFPGTTGDDFFEDVVGAGDTISDGGGGSDVLRAGPGDDVVTVTGGVDQASGGVGLDDLLIVDYRAETLNISSGGHTTSQSGSSGGFGNEGSSTAVYVSGFERIHIWTGSGNDAIYTGIAADMLFGGDGNDALDSSAGVDIVDGGNGIDRWLANKSHATDGNGAINLNLTANTYTGPGSVTNIEVVTLTLGDANDVVVTSTAALDDIVHGGSGDDIITVAGGVDLAGGGTGDDLLVVDYSAATSSISTGGTVAGVLNATGGYSSVGSSTAVYVSGFERIHISTGSANDNLYTGNGNDMLSGGGGDDDLSGLAGDDTLNGESGDDTLNAGAGFDTLIGGEGKDVLDGGSNPSNQGDFLLGGDGDDTYHVDSALDFVDEGSVFPQFGFGGTDTIVSTADFFWDLYSVGERLVVSEDVVDPEGDGVTIVHSVFSGELVGHSGTDIMFGRGGADTYRPGAGIDFMSFSTLGLTEENAYGGVNGVNTLAMEVGNSYDIVFEFEAGRDKVDVSAFDLASTADLFARGFDDGIGNSYFALGDGFDYLYLVGLELADLQAGDFIV